MNSTSLYAPLETQDTIRLLRFKTGNDGDGIELMLKPFRLSSAVEFIALSYVWGSPTPKRWVTCNGHRVSVTPTLHGALSQLLQKGLDGLLWVDALCINQQENKEKSAQVAMMQEIFSQAAKVVFWLGEQQDFDEDGARLMRTFFQNHPDPLGMRGLQDKSLGELGLPYFDLGWIGWASLLTRPWFGRVWIVQEFLSAKESLFMSGAVEIPTKVLMSCAVATTLCTEIHTVFLSQAENEFSSTRLLDRLFFLHGARVTTRIEGNKDIEINHIWKWSRFLEATDERDRVFALLSLQTTLPMDIIDYSKDPVDIYTEVAKLALTESIPSKPSSRSSHNSLEIETYRSSRYLACKGCSLNESMLPSWVPDWRPSSIRFTPLTEYFLGTSSFNHPYQDAVIENKIMSISGVFVDRPWIIVNSMPYVEDLLFHLRQDFWDPLQVSDNWAKAILNWQYMCYVLARSRYQSLAAFCRTMAFGALSKQDDVTIAEYIGGFQALREGMLTTIQEDDRHGAVFEGPKGSNRRCREYQNRFAELSPGRKFCVTQTGRLAWIPQVAKPGDEICFLAGCAVPFVIRQAGELWELLGDCYLDGMMSYKSPVYRPRPQLFKFT